MDYSNPLCTYHLGLMIGALFGVSLSCLVLFTVSIIRKVKNG